MRPLRACVVAKDFKMLKRIWRRLQTWESCHFYKLVELFIEREEVAGFEMFLNPTDKFIRLFYEPKVIQSIIEAHKQATSAVSANEVSPISEGHSAQPRSPRLTSIHSSLMLKLQALIEEYNRQVFDCPIAEWERTYKLEGDESDWNGEVWNAMASKSAHPSYVDTVNAIRELADHYGITTNVEECSITPLHYIFAKNIKNQSLMPRLIEKIKKIDPEVCNLKELVQVRQKHFSARRIQEDSFLDGGVFLLWCLRYNRPILLNLLLGEDMSQFWRFAQLKTLVWACF